MIDRRYLAVVALVAGVAAVSLAHDGGRHHGGVHGAGHGGPGMRGQLRTLFQYLDQDRNGSLQRTEAEAVILDRLATFDTDESGALVLEEFEGLWLDFSRRQMVDRFQSLDEDGDGMVTEAEMTDPLARLFRRADLNEDGTLDRTDRQLRRGRGPAPATGEE
ncbi:MAG: hypothetical protein AAGD08_05700 [Pseudomonadota bacterium]